MRKFLFTAAVATVLAVPGVAHAGTWHCDDTGDGHPGTVAFPGEATPPEGLIGCVEVTEPGPTHIGAGDPTMAPVDVASLPWPSFDDPWSGNPAPSEAVEVEVPVEEPAPVVETTIIETAPAPGAPADVAPVRAAFTEHALLHIGG